MSRTKDFVEACKREHDAGLARYLEGKRDGSAVAHHLHQAGLTEEQRTHVSAALRDALTDTYYTILLGLDGCASLGDVQQRYRLYDQAGELISEDDGGNLESYAYEVFQEMRDAP